MLHFISLCVLLVVSTHSAWGQKISKHGNVYTPTFSSVNPAEAHNSGNTFAREVGDTLKALYPSKVTDPSVSVRIYTKNGKRHFQFIWTCRIDTASVAEADMRFDRRGTFLPGLTSASVKLRVGEELKKSGKVSIGSNFHRFSSSSSLVRSSLPSAAHEKFWYIKEYFFVAPR